MNISAMAALATIGGIDIRPRIGGQVVAESFTDGMNTIIIQLKKLILCLLSDAI